jgi:hypothetical protein
VLLPQLEASRIGLFLGADSAIPCFEEALPSTKTLDQENKYAGDMVCITRGGLKIWEQQKKRAIIIMGS